MELRLRLALNMYKDCKHGQQHSDWTKNNSIYSTWKKFGDKKLCTTW